MKKLYHMNVSIFSRGKGHNFRGKLSYRDGGIYVDADTGKTVNHSNKFKKDKIENDFITPAGADESLHNRNDYYDQLEQKEKAKNAQYFREFEVALPNDIPKEHKKDIARKFGESLAAEGMFVDLNYHKLDSNNPHCHILTSMRGVNEKGLLGNKNREWNDRSKIPEWRERFASVINDKYKELGIDNHVSEKSYKEQGIKKIPTKKLPVDKKSEKYKSRMKENKSINLENKNNFVKEIKDNLPNKREDLHYKKEDLKELTKIINTRITEKKSVGKLIDEKINQRKDLMKQKLNISVDKKIISSHEKIFKQKEKEKDRGLSL